MSTGFEKLAAKAEALADAIGYSTGDPLVPRLPSPISLILMECAAALRKYAQQHDALKQAEAVMSIVQPRSDAAEYRRILGVVREALGEAS